MRRQIPGLHLRQQNSEVHLDGLFLVRVERASYRWHPQKPFVELRFVVLEPKPFETRSLSGQLYCTDRALWKLNWFLRDFGYDADLLNCDQVDERALLNLRGVVRTSHKILNGRSYQNLDSFAPASEWEVLSCISIDEADAQDGGRGGSDGL
ncbi:MAG TPA: hypothetical protein VOA64_20855 [Candidatus Dormibacteraeota bacterium]|nr:hypothetical protein [Candidatus Dormibacteraeota bacterium]